jgi:hypothetical protein
MIAALTTLYAALADSGLDMGGLEARAAHDLKDWNLTPEGIVNQYL